MLPIGFLNGRCTLLAGNYVAQLWSVMHNIARSDALAVACSKFDVHRRRSYLLHCLTLNSAESSPKLRGDTRRSLVKKDLHMYYSSTTLLRTAPISILVTANQRLCVAKHIATSSLGKRA
ncbi:hypothetical protein L484_027292 [Morus notabilis]|uniref:Uncharacterized protein n=1 Tax=Morus notabilis TaxID=981085 RepID=W9QS71_9ROSA|nr:hypothetical protein L484_027292 [Morus notabilis]